MKLIAAIVISVFVLSQGLLSNPRQNGWLVFVALGSIEPGTTTIADSLLANPVLYAYAGSTKRRLDEYTVTSFTCNIIPVRSKNEIQAYPVSGNRLNDSLINKIKGLKSGAVIFFTALQFSDTAANITFRNSSSGYTIK